MTCRACCQSHRAGSPAAWRRPHSSSSRVAARRRSRTPETGGYPGSATDAASIPAAHPQPAPPSPHPHADPPAHLPPRRATGRLQEQIGGARQRCAFHPVSAQARLYRLQPVVRSSSPALPAPAPAAAARRPPCRRWAARGSPRSARCWTAACYAPPRLTVQSHSRLGPVRCLGTCDACRLEEMTTRDAHRCSISRMHTCHRSDNMYNASQPAPVRL